MIDATYIGPPATTNWMMGRSENPITMIVLHTMVGTIESADARFKTVGQYASAHYGVGYNGDRLVQWVHDIDTAYHAGDFGVNLGSIGIEHEDLGGFNDPRPDALYELSAQLVNTLCHAYNIPIDEDHIKPHYAVSDQGTGCPDALDWRRIIQMADALDHVAPTPPPFIGEKMATRETVTLPTTDGKLHESFPGLYIGVLPNGLHRHVFVSAYCDSDDGDSGTTITAFTQDANGNVGGQQTLVIPVSQDTADNEITWVTGRFALQIKSDGRQRCRVSVKCEDWPT